MHSRQAQRNTAPEGECSSGSVGRESEPSTRELRLRGADKQKRMLLLLLLLLLLLCCCCCPAAPRVVLQLLLLIVAATQSIAQGEQQRRRHYCPGAAGDLSIRVTGQQLNKKGNTDARSFRTGSRRYSLGICSTPVQWCSNWSSSGPSS